MVRSAQLEPNHPETNQMTTNNELEFRAMAQLETARMTARDERVTKKARMEAELRADALSRLLFGIAGNSPKIVLLLRALQQKYAPNEVSQ